MAVGFDAASGFADSATATSHAWSHTVGAGSNRLLLVWWQIQAGGLYDVTSITWGAQSLTQVGSWVTSTGTDSQVELWALWGPSSGTSTITVTTAGATRGTFEAQSWTGALSLGSAATGTGTTSTTATATASGAGANDMITSAVCAVGSSSTLPTASGTSMTLDSAQSCGISTKTIGAAAHQPGTAGASAWTIPSESSWLALAIPVLATAPAAARRPVIVVPRRAPMIRASAV